MRRTAQVNARICSLGPSLPHSSLTPPSPLPHPKAPGVDLLFTSYGPCSDVQDDEALVDDTRCERLWEVTGRGTGLVQIVSPGGATYSGPLGKPRPCFVSTDNGECEGKLCLRSLLSFSGRWEPWRVVNKRGTLSGDRILKVFQKILRGRTD